MPDKASATGDRPPFQSAAQPYPETKSRQKIVPVLGSIKR